MTVDWIGFIRIRMQEQMHRFHNEVHKTPLLHSNREGELTGSVNVRVSCAIVKKFNKIKIRCKASTKVLCTGYLTRLNTEDTTRSSFRSIVMIPKLAQTQITNKFTE